jgi:hypothetical protein
MQGGNGTGNKLRGQSRELTLEKLIVSAIAHGLYVVDQVAWGIT